MDEKIVLILVMLLALSRNAILGINLPNNMVLGEFTYDYDEKILFLYNESGKEMRLRIMEVGFNHDFRYGHDIYGYAYDYIGSIETALGRADLYKEQTMDSWKSAILKVNGHYIEFEFTTRDVIEVEEVENLLLNELFVRN